MLEYLSVRKEVVVRKKLYRNVILYDNKFLRIINNKPEIRWRVNRSSIRELIGKMID